MKAQDKSSLTDNSQPKTLFSSEGKTLDEILGFYVSLTLSNAVTAQQTYNNLLVSAAAKLIEQAQTLPPDESVKLLKQSQSLFKFSNSIKELKIAVKEIKDMLE